MNNGLTNQDGSLRDDMLRTHYGLVTLEPAKDYFMPGDKKIIRMNFQGFSPMDKNLMIFMIISTNAKGQEVSNLEFVNKNSAIAQRIWSDVKPPAGYVPLPELVGFGTVNRIDPNNCQLYLTLTRPASGAPIMVAPNFTGLRLADLNAPNVIGRVRVKIHDGVIADVTIL